MSRPEPVKLPLSPIFETGRGAAYQADAVAFLQALPDESVDLVVTSPPYDGQPKYQKGEVYDRAWYQGGSFSRSRPSSCVFSSPTETSSSTTGAGATTRNAG